MEIQNAFVGRTETPTAEELDSALGPSAAVWHELVEWMEAHGAPEEEWKSSGAKYGWSLRLKQKKRNIVYLSPCEGCMRIAFILGDRAVAAARQAHLPKRVLDALEGAPRYPEGTGLRLTVRSVRDLPAIEKLAQIKMAN
jgi:hypothetical protein